MRRGGVVKNRVFIGLIGLSLLAISACGGSSASDTVVRVQNDSGSDLISLIPSLSSSPQFEPRDDVIAVSADFIVLGELRTINFTARGFECDQAYDFRVELANGTVIEDFGTYLDGDGLVDGNFVPCGQTRTWTVNPFGTLPTFRGLVAAAAKGDSLVKPALQDRPDAQVLGLTNWSDEPFAMPDQP